VEPRPPSDEEIQARVEARLARQAILSGDAPLQYWVVLDEAVLRRAVGGPRVMAEQLRVLASAARRRNIKLQVLSFSIGAHPGACGQFAVLCLYLGFAAVFEYAYV